MIRPIVEAFFKHFLMQARPIKTSLLDSRISRLSPRRLGQSKFHPDKIPGPAPGVGKKARCQENSSSFYMHFPQTGITFYMIDYHAVIIIYIQV
jgi:hypothetical protein